MATTAHLKSVFAHHMRGVREGLILLSLLTLHVISAVANEPDSVYIFAYNPRPSDGLAFAFSADGHHWNSVGGGSSFVRSDYGTWGAEKKMHTPILSRSDEGGWRLIFRVNDRAREYATTTSPDLIHWLPQDYPFLTTVSDVQRLFDEAVARYYRTAVVNGQTYKGCIHRVSFAEVRAMNLFKQAAAHRDHLNRETLADDATRFAFLHDNPPQATVTIDTAARKAISDKLIGIFFEDINYSADGGLYAELVQNRDFEYNEGDGGREAGWNATHSWSVTGEGAFFAIQTDDPVHPNQAHYAVLNTTSSGGALVNRGYDGITLRKGETYDISLFARVCEGKPKAITVELRDGDRVVGTAKLAAPTSAWKRISGTIRATDDVAAAQLAVGTDTQCRLAMDIVSLFPRKTFKGRKNGMRPDLAQTLADLHPRFMRFPGGCVAHGDGIANIYNWKETIGPIQTRKGARNLWGYHQTRGLGFYEYFQFCEDIGCEPLPVLAAGVPCQNSSRGGGGQQGGIPLGPDMEQYVQDVLDLIEWANGDPKNSVWAKRCAEAGHPKPFNLKYIGIGNEDLISNVFAKRYLMIIRAVKAKYPDIQVCGTVGPFFEGSDYEQGWRLAKDNHIDMVDEHYYVSPGWYINNQDYYDQYDRTASKVYLGEYASHGPGRKSTIETALTCAMHICNLERNGDIVAMSSYAPLLAKHGHTQWNPDLIYFDNERVYPTVDYWVQMMCGQAQGNEYLPTYISMQQQRHDTDKRLAVSTVRDTATGKTYVKVVNLLPAQINTHFNLRPLDVKGRQATVKTLTGTWNDTKAVPSQPQHITLDKEIDLPLPAYSLTVLEIN